MSEKKLALAQEILSSHGYPGDVRGLPVTGLANQIFATDDVVLRIANNSIEALKDAYTESVAMPVLNQTNIPTPAMLVFEDSKEFTETPYSIWERVKADTIGLLPASSPPTPALWQEIGVQLANVHYNVPEFPDPKRLLHYPERTCDIQRLVEKESADFPKNSIVVKKCLDFFKANSGMARAQEKPVYLHGDLKPMNLMSNGSNEFKAFIDWGDSGWGDPSLDFRFLSETEFLPILDGYLSVVSASRRRFITCYVWDRIWLELVGSNTQKEKEQAISNLFDFYDRERSY